MECYTGMIMPFAGNYAPEGWLPCDGRLVRTWEYQALFSIIGNTYGGDGKETFALPDMRGKVIVGMGVNPETGTSYTFGQKQGTEAVQLNANQLPPHTHQATFTGTGSTAKFENVAIKDGVTQVTVPLPNNATNENDPSLSSTPTQGASFGIGNSNGRPANIYSTNAPNIRLGAESVTAEGTVTGTVEGNVSVTPSGTVNVDANNGVSAPVSIMQPYQVLNYIICVSGLYPLKP